jgi:hypothetical protein
MVAGSVDIAANTCVGVAVAVFAAADVAATTSVAAAATLSHASGKTGFAEEVSFGSAAVVSADSFWARAVDVPKMLKLDSIRLASRIIEKSLWTERERGGRLMISSFGPCISLHKYKVGPN